MNIVIQENMDVEDIPPLPNSYEYVMSIYRNVNFIPFSAFDIILKHHFPSSTIILKEGMSNDFVMKVKVKDLLTAPIKNWKCNRPPDKVRCKEIARYIYNNQQKINTAFYFSYDNINCRFDVFDGIHRLTALKKIKEENSKPFIVGEFGCNNDATWLYNQYVIVYMYFNATEGNIIDLFKSLNKSISVPELYLKDRNDEKVQVIETVCKEWQKRHKKHFSESKTPHLGNINRDTFIDLLDKLYDKHNIYECESSIDELNSKLEEANKRISQKIPMKASVEARVKCKLSGCYLFLYRNDELLEIV